MCYHTAEDFNPYYRKDVKIAASKQFEYKVIDCAYSITIKLNQLGQEGWELCGMWNDYGILKREVK
jgi:hypothetical protein